MSQYAVTQPPILIDARTVCQEYLSGRISPKTWMRWVADDKAPPPAAPTQGKRSRKLWVRSELELWIGTGCEPYRKFRPRLEAARSRAAKLMPVSSQPSNTDKLRIAGGMNAG